MRIHLLLLLFVLPLTQAATWCGKAYLPGDPAVPPPPSSHFFIPPLSSHPLLDFQCVQAVTPYVEGEENGSVIVALEIGHRRGVACEEEGDSEWRIEVAEGGHVLVQGVLRPGGKTVLSFGLDVLEARKESFTFRCSATSVFGNLEVDAPFRYLPPNPYGIVVKMDALTGNILVPERENLGVWEPFFPHGFYVSFGGEGALETNPDLLVDLMSKGMNTIHPVPPFDNLTALSVALDKAEELGLYLMYDMRWTYKNLSSVEEQTRMIQTRSNLLLWYTADEPDGVEDPLNATKFAYDLITELDGYHPISVVLNCDNFEWTPHVSGADIVLTDPYPLHINTTYSSRYATVCNSTYGCCGCDNCEGGLRDIAKRLDDNFERISLNGRNGNLTVWTVLQGHGGAEFWSEPPNEREFFAMAVIALNHGTKGLVSWLAPTTPEIMAATHRISLALPHLAPLLLSSNAIRTVPHSNASNSIDAALWTEGDSSLLMLVNQNPVDVVDFSIDLPFTPMDGGTVVFSDGVVVFENVEQTTGLRLKIEPYGVFGFVLQAERTITEATAGLAEMEELVFQVF